ncbi:MAG: transcriptional regulator [Methylobacter sp.]|nr:transcriptional regulator [Methylobacter sp.]MDP2429842.1 transcriptional regulator [Methylobacter sp.]MDP3054747.1 transcriptional regulator [Methylobacter sp.]MDP3362203.1 transcriptional regulator [Methylobacter sp.]MDZ4218520.1 transcriptional regulator [Methylobacter sp.]
MNEKNEKQEFAQRLRNAMLANGYEARPTVLEKGFNTRYWGRSVTVQAVTRWLRGEAIPSQEKLQVLAEWLKIEPHALRFGEQAAESIRAKRRQWDEALDFQERETIERYLGLPAQQRKVVREVIEAFAKAFPNEASTL